MWRFEKQKRNRNGSVFVYVLPRCSIGATGVYWCFWMEWAKKQAKTSRFLALECSNFVIQFSCFLCEEVGQVCQFVILCLVAPWDPSKNQEKQVSGHLYATTLDHLRPHTQYKARIKATNDLGDGQASNVIAVRKSGLKVTRLINRKRDSFDLK